MNDEWSLPENGELEFDYVNVIDKPDPKDVVDQIAIDKLVDWFKC